MLDPFMGSGTTAIAARTVDDANGLALNISSEYCELARERIKDAIEKLLL